MQLRQWILLAILLILVQYIQQSLFFITINSSTSHCRENSLQEAKKSRELIQGTKAISEETELVEVLEESARLVPVFVM